MPNISDLLRSLKSLPTRPRRPLPLGTLSSTQVFNHNLEISALGRAHKISAARRLFDRMPSRDVVSWNAIITAYWQNGDIVESKKIFDSMPEKNIVSWNSMITGCLESGSLGEALEYFDVMPERNVASWNAIISGLVKLNRMDEAERLFAVMPVRNVISYTTMVDGFARSGEIDRAQRLFNEMPRKNVVSWAAMISGYVENGMFKEAKDLFDRMPEKNVVAFTAMITGYCKEGRVERARSLFDAIQKKDLISWNAMIAGYAHNGYSEEALTLHVQMLERGMKPDHATLIAVLTACSSLALLQRGRQTHTIAIKTRLETNTSLSNALITMYSKCGSIGESELVFQNICTRDVVSWNTIIAACAQHGHYQKALELFFDMETNGSVPNAVTFLSVLSSCAHVGKVNESLDWFSLMQSKYGISPRPEHYACIVDILSRAGQLEKAYEYIKKMPYESEGSVWGALLGACQMYSNVELGVLAAEKLVKLDPRNSGAYVMLSNIYAAAGMWKEVRRIRGLMKEQGAKKQPGYSWTEIYNNVHLFLVGDVSHPEINEIHSELRRISLHMKMATYESDVLDYSHILLYHEDALCLSVAFQ